MNVSVYVFLHPRVSFLIKIVDLDPVVFAEAVEKENIYVYICMCDPNISKCDLFFQRST